MSQIVVHVAVVHDLVIGTESQGKRLLVVRDRGHYLPIEIRVVGLVVVVVVDLYDIAIDILVRKGAAGVNQRLVGNAHVNAVHHELEVGF